MSSEPDPVDDEPVPRLPRGRGIKLDRGMLMRIFATVALLVMLIVAARPCANATSKFVTDFDQQGSASDTMPKPGNVDQLGPEYEVISPNMTDEERKAAIERAKQKAAATNGGSGATGGSASDGSGGRGSAGSGSAGSDAQP